MDQNLWRDPAMAYPIIWLQEMTASRENII
jgi:hypothetical protein